MELNFGEAMREAIAHELRSDYPTVFFGQDIHYNIYGFTHNLVEEFGEDRVVATPISEAAVVGLAIGAALTGVRTIVDLTVANFLYVAMDQIVNIASKNAYMYNGAFNLPVTIMAGEFYNCGNAAQHSDRLHSLFLGIPGLKVVAPSTPQDAYSLLRASICDRNPVLFFSDRTLFYTSEIIDFTEVGKIGVSKVLIQGNDVTLVAVSGALPAVKLSLEELARFNVIIELIDVCTVVPLDKEVIKESVRKTGRLVIVDMSNRSGSLAGHIGSFVVEECFDSLKAPVGYVTYADVPTPFENTLERELIPNKDCIVKKVLDVFHY